MEKGVTFERYITYIIYIEVIVKTKQFVEENEYHLMVKKSNTITKEVFKNR